jgi:GDPmannose 4,6-dehydratase
LFGKVQEIPQRETTPFYPRSPYACAKLYAYWIHGQLSRGLWDVSPATASCSTTNRPCGARPSSPARSRARWPRIKLGLQDQLYLGNLDARRDWGHARDYVEMQWLMLQQDASRGLRHRHRPPAFGARVRRKAAAEVDIAIEWRGQGIDEKGIDADSGREIVAVDPRYFRPTEVESLLGDASRAREKLGWTPRIGFDELVREMMQADLELARRDHMVEREGYKAFHYYE